MFFPILESLSPQLQEIARPLVQLLAENSTVVLIIATVTAVLLAWKVLAH